MSDIIEKSLAYLEFQKESFGDNLLAEIEPRPADSNPDIAVPKAVEVASEPTVQFIKPVIASIEQVVPGKSVSPDWRNATSINDLNNKINKCMECQLGKTRKNFVFGSGNPDADIMIIGEAPGADEDELGLPFVGRAGQLLTKIMEAIQINREEVYIANIVKCRPPNNREPEKIEVDSCEPYLKKQIDLIKPEFILSLGLTSVNTLLKKTHKMADIRGKLTDYYGIKMFVTYHPAALLRNPAWKKLVWEDVQIFRKLYDDYLITKK